MRPQNCRIDLATICGRKADHGHAVRPIPLGIYLWQVYKQMQDAQKESAKSETAVDHNGIEKLMATVVEKRDWYPGDQNHNSPNKVKRSSWIPTLRPQRVTLPTRRTRSRARKDIPLLC